MADEIPERVYLDAARASVAARFPGRPAFAAWAKVDDAEPGFRAAVASAYRAGQAAVPKTDIWFDGYQAGHFDERAGLNRDAAVPLADATPADGQDGDSHGRAA